MLALDEIADMSIGEAIYFLTSKIKGRKLQLRGFVTISPYRERQEQMDTSLDMIGITQQEIDDKKYALVALRSSAPGFLQYAVYRN